jgi:deazaflavin-dependent oxidoreductase (nitroreductase family)
MDLIGGGLRPWFGVTPEGHALVMAKAREAQAAATRGRRAWLPPRWFVVMFWHGHRALLRVTRGRVGLWRPKPDGWGALRLTTTGRRTGRPRQVVVGYVEDGRNLITMAMNGWGAAEPAWWLNLQAHPDATAQTRDGARRVRARRAQGDERERLWSRWAEIDKNLDAYAARRPAETAMVVLEPRDTAGPAAGPGPTERATASPEGGAQ